MSSRRLVCEAAFGYGPFDTVPAVDWVELVDAQGPRLRAADWGFGRDSEFDHFTAGTATVLLSNRDRHLDPDNASSPHVGNLLPNVPVRLRSKNEDTGTFEDEFYGFVRGGWEQQIDTNQSDCRLELQDLLGVMGGYKLPDVFHNAILAYSPVGFWVLDGGGNPDADQVPDLGSGRNDGQAIGEGIQLGDKPVAPGQTPAANFTVAVDATTGETTFGSVDVSRSQILSSMSNAVLVATFVARSKGSLNWRTLFVHSRANTSVWLSGHTGIQAHIDTAGKLVFVSLTNGLGTAYITADAVVGKAGLFRNNTGHIMFGAVGAGLGLDTVTLSTGTTSSGIGSKNGVSIGGGPGVDPKDHMDGWIGTVALFTSLTSQGRTDIFNGYQKLSGQRSDQHITWALDRLGVPAGLRNLDAGTVFMGAADTDGVDALEWMRDVTSTEGGGLYVDHRDGGKVRFTNRYHRHLSTRSVTAQAIFSDQPGAAVVRYPAEGLDITPNGLDGIINQVTVTWRDGEVVVEDAASVAAYGARPRQLDTQATTAGQARSAGEWVIANYGQPRSRVRGATSSARSMQARDDKVEALRVDDRVTFRVQPMKTGSVTEVDLFIDGVTHSAHGVQWDTSFRFAPGHTFTPWIWGTSAWNTTAFWG